MVSEHGKPVVHNCGKPPSQPCDCSGEHGKPARQEFPADQIAFVASMLATDRIMPSEVYEAMCDRIDTLTAQVEGLRTTPDALQTLLDLVTDTIEPDDLVIGNGGDPNVPPWYCFAYFFSPSSAPPEDGWWEINVKGDTLREVLCAVIVHPRFGQ